MPTQPHPTGAVVSKSEETARVKGLPTIANSGQSVAHNVAAAGLKSRLCDNPHRRIRLEALTLEEAAGCEEFRDSQGMDWPVA